MNAAEREAAEASLAMAEADAAHLRMKVAEADLALRQVQGQLASVTLYATRLRVQLFKDEGGESDAPL